MLVHDAKPRAGHAGDAAVAGRSDVDLLQDLPAVAGPAPVAKINGHVIPVADRAVLVVREQYRARVHVGDHAAFAVRIGQMFTAN